MMSGKTLHWLVELNGLGFALQNGKKMVTHILDKSNPVNVKHFARIYTELDITKRWEISIKQYRTQRSLQQNRWARKFATEWGKSIGYEADEAYDLLMFKCNPVFKIDPSTGEQIRMPGHLSDLDTKEAAEVQDRMQRFCAGLGFYLDEQA
jgi:hypothetical protein